MKTLMTAVSVFALGSVLHVAAQAEKVEKKTDVTENSDGSVTKTETKTTTTFNPEARTKVVQYFDTYKTDPYGLPPAWVTRMKMKEIPTTWRTTIAPGVVLAEKERSYLVDAPPELVKVLPAPGTGVRYYVAGSNVVAIDPSFRIVDSIAIPSIKIISE